MPVGYQLVRYLGRGSTGLVVCARQVELDRLVAIKTIYGGARGADMRARLDREAKILARLRHPNIVQVLTLIPAGDDLAMVMEFVDGTTWAEELGRRPGVERILSVLGQIANALEYLARQRITHRDLKPSNVLIAVDGTAKLADFGLSRLIADTSWFRTSAEVGLGTRGYAAPEQLSDPGAERVESDHYAFAAMAYRSLSGERPQAGPVSAEALRKIGFPASAAAALAAGLAADPTRRPSPVEVMAALGSVPAGQWAHVRGAAVAVPGDREVGAPPGVAHGAARDTAADKAGQTAADKVGGTVAEMAVGTAIGTAVGTDLGTARGTDAAADAGQGADTGFGPGSEADGAQARRSSEALVTLPIGGSDPLAGVATTGVPFVIPPSFRPPKDPLYRRISPLLIGFVVGAVILVCVLVLT